MADTGYNLYECSKYGCGHLWIGESLGNDSMGYRRSYREVPCPACKNKTSQTELVRNVNPTYEIAKLNPSTYAKARFRNDKEVIAYADDAVLSLLKRNKFSRPTSPNGWNYDLTYRHKDYVAFFREQRGRTTTDLFLMFPKNDPILKEVKEAIKQAKADIKATAAKPKPQIAGMLDAANQDLKVGDYVAYWATKSLEFGKIREFVKTPDGGWRSTQLVTAAKVVSLRGTMIPTPKLKNQIFLLPEERALLLMLER